MKLILLGAPGCGKGTQAVSISETYNLPHISTGDLFRENIANRTPLGLKVKEIIDNGNLCPDDLTCALVEDRLSRDDCKNGYLLDGFPRNLFQANELEKISAPDKILDIEVDLSKIEKRITGRRICKKCGASHHIDFIGDKKECPICGGELYIRKDDVPEVIKERLSVYASQTQPLIDFYKSKNKLIKINGDQKIDEVFSEIVKALEK